MVQETSAVALLTMGKPSKPDYRLHGGVYQIVHNETGREYIGKAAVFFDRWKRHVQDLTAGTHHSWRLQRDWEKFGPTAFSFDVVEQVRDTRPCGLLPREQHYLDTLRPYYNICPVAGSTQNTTRGMSGLIATVMWSITEDGKAPQVETIAALREVEEYLLSKVQPVPEDEKYDPHFFTIRRMQIAEIKAVQTLIAEMDGA